MIMNMLILFKGVVEKMQADLMAGGGMGMVGGGIMGSMLNVDKMIPVQIFQMIVGIYMVEVVAMLAMFLSKIQYGEESLMRKFNVGKLVLLASGIYISVVVLLYSAFTGLMPMMITGG
jgi:F0F1-type ATP synthase membrane subunit c/vacuolar-type H+-ATPase subunit K